MIPVKEIEYGEWKNIGNCKANGIDNCGEGIQLQNRTCQDGTIDKCKAENMTQEIPCALPECTTIIPSNGNFVKQTGFDCVLI